MKYFEASLQVCEVKKKAKEMIHMLKKKEFRTGNKSYMFSLAKLNIRYKNTVRL